jgi:hypothetical protein
MTELAGYNPNHAPQNNPNRNGLVFVDQYDREHNIATEQSTPVAAPDIEQAKHQVDALFAQKALDLERAAAEQREAKANDEQRRYAVECDTIAMANIQDYAVIHGLDPEHEQRTQKDFDLAG